MGVQDIFELLARVTEPLRISLFTVGGAPVSAGDLMQLLVLIALAWWLGAVVERDVRQLGQRHGSADAGSVATVARLLRWAIVLLGALIALSMIGLPLSHLAIMVSALSVGIGFGLQTIVNNSVAGLILLSERAVRVGDFVQLPDGERGEVRAISMRSTRILTPDGVYVLVPNATLIDGTVKNLSLDAAGHRKRYTFGVAYGSDPAAVARAVTDAARGVPYTVVDASPGAIDHGIEVGVSGFGNFALMVELVVWVRLDSLMEPYRVDAAYLEAIAAACARAGIVMPAPAYDINVRSLVPVQLASDPASNPAQRAGHAAGGDQPQEVQAGTPHQQG